MERNQTWLPEHLARWVNPAVVGSMLDESALNCGSCARFVGKCCTFQPYVANYNILQFSSHANYFHAPIGLLATYSFQLKHRATKSGERGEDLLCSFYERPSGRCSRWSNRPAECAAHFCESTHGARGTEFWNNLSHQLNRMEVAVAQMAMVEMGFSHHDIGEQVSWLAKAPKSFDPKSIWKDWYGQEHEYYTRCAEWAAQISREQVDEWLKA